MARKDNPDDARNFTIGQMKDVHAELNEPEWIVLAQDSMTPSAFDRFDLAKAKVAAGKNGRVIEVTKHTNRKGEVTSVTVSVEKPNPKFKGGKGAKGHGKRKFLK